MKNKTAKFIALLLAVFIFPLSFSACKSGNTELSAESVADICIENRQVWEFGENSVGNCGYCFIDLDLTACRSSCQRQCRAADFSRPTFSIK